MEQLPMAPNCALDETGQRRQYERYRQAGEGAGVVERNRRCVVVEFAEDVDPRLVEQLIAVERECCPFFDLSWEPEGRRLTVAVSRAEHEPALDAIAFALDLDGSARSAPLGGGRSRRLPAKSP